MTTISHASEPSCTSTWQPERCCWAVQTLSCSGLCPLSSDLCGPTCCCVLPPRPMQRSRPWVPWGTAVRKLRSLFSGTGGSETGKSVSCVCGAGAQTCWAPGTGWRWTPRFWPSPPSLRASCTRWSLPHNPPPPLLRLSSILPLPPPAVHRPPDFPPVPLPLPFLPFYHYREACCMCWRLGWNRERCRHAPTLCSDVALKPSRRILP